MRQGQARNWQRDYIQHPSEQQQKKVVIKIKKRGWVTKGEKLLYTLLCTFLVIAGLYIVSFSSSTDSLNRNLQSLESNVQQKVVTNEGLLYEVRELSQPERITKIAKENGLKIQDTKVKQASISID